MRFRLALLLLAVVSIPVSAQTQPHDPLKRTGFLGLAVGPVTGEARKAQSLKGDGGVLLIRVTDNSSAADAGMKAGDVVTHVDGTAVAGVPQFLGLVTRRKAGDTVKVGYVRDAKEQSYEIKMKPRPFETSKDFEVIYDSVAAKAGRMRTIATKPKGTGKFPALFIIQGLGGYSIESSPVAPGMYAPFVEAFTKAGWVTYRVEKPGQGDSEGGPTQDVDFETELDTYRQALKALKALDYVDGSNVVIFGHSMGGVMGPILSAEIPVKGVSAYGTMSKTWAEYMLENLRRQMVIEGASPGVIEKTMRDDTAFHYLVCLGGKSPEEVAKEHPELAPRVSELVQQGKYLAGRHYTFFRQLAARNVAEAWEKHDGHSLAIWGRADFVSSEVDHQWIAAIANGKHQGRGKAVTLEGIDHGFDRCDTAAESRSRFGKGGGEFNPIIVTTLLDWSKGILKEKP